MPINYADYNPDFPEVSQRVRFEREGGRCQHCGRVHGETYEVPPPPPKFRYDPDQTRLFGSVGPDPPPPMPRTVKVVLTTAHLDHDTRNDSDDNLAALCSACHLKYDRADNAIRAKYGKGWPKIQQPINFSRSDDNESISQPDPV